MPEVYKRLGAIAPTDDNEYLLYAAPSGTQSLISNITVANRSSSSATFDINVYEQEPNIVPEVLQGFVAIEKNSLKIYSSQDGQNWTDTGKKVNDISSFFIYSKNKMIASPDTLIYIGNSKYYSKDLGKTWNTISSPLPSDVAYGNGTFVAFTTFGSTYTSTDAITWTVVSGGPSGFPSLADSPLLFVNNTFVKMIGSSSITSSTDGLTWSSNTLSVATQSMAPSGYNYAEAIGYIGGRYIVAGIESNGNNFIQDSTDLVTWTQRTLPISDTWQSIAYSSSAAILQGRSSLLRSTDGITWTQTTISFSPGKVSHYNGVFSVVNGNNYAASTDGIIWTEGLTTKSLLSSNTIEYTAAPFSSELTKSLYKMSEINANSTLVLEPGIALSASASIVAKDNSGGNLTISTYGVELS